MKTIGIRELKATLSAVIREVQGGETVLVTDRGRVVAELRAPGKLGTRDSLDRALYQMSAEGTLRVAKHPPVPYEASPIKAPTGTAQAILDEERGKR